MRKNIENLLEKYFLMDFSFFLLRNLRWLIRKVRGTDFFLLKKYHSSAAIKKLHIGCGKNFIAGWLNSDYYPKSEDILHLDATTKFPFNDDTFDYIFSEHMIEHIPYASGSLMFSECYRILKNKGKIRISTPDLQFLIDLYKKEKSEVQIDYIKWATDQSIQNAPYCDDTFVINNYVRDWGHKFIYDEKTLSKALKIAGFTNIVRFDINQSQDESLQSLENESRMPAGFLRLESFTLEATKLSI